LTDQLNNTKKMRLAYFQAAWTPAPPR